MKIIFKGNLYESEDKKYRYYGNCVNSFEEETGDSLISIFNNVSDFAVVDENSDIVDKNSNLSKLEIPTKLIDIVNKPDTILKYADYRDIYFIYDEDADIHYFFAK